MMSTFVARHYVDGIPRRWRIEGDRIAEAEALATETSCDLWAAPAFWDIQLNGRWGWSFSDESLTVERVIAIVHAQARLGSAKICPTLITASPEGTLHGVATIAEAIRRDPLVDHMIVGVHLEGPWISGLDGYRGAHPLSAVRDPDLAEFETWWKATEGRIAIVTLAPERAGAIEAIRALTARGVTVSVAHSAADGATLAAAREAGAKFSTHLGNGIVGVLPRHPNPIWHQAADDGLMASFIADRHHLDPVTLEVLIRAKGMGRTIAVSDFSPLAGLLPGTYGPWEVHESGKIVVAGTPYLAGSNQSLETGVNTLLAMSDETLTDRGRLADPLVAVLDTVAANPARLLGREIPKIEPGAPADLVLFERTDAPRRIALRATYVKGERFELAAEEPVPFVA